MNFLLDTCVLVEMTRPSPAQLVMEWLRVTPQPSLFVSVCTLAELSNGVWRLPEHEQSPFLGWLSEIRERHADRVLDVTTAVAVEWGRLRARAERQGSRLPAMRAWIGATAVVHGLALATHDTSDLATTGVPILNPWA